MAQIVVVGAGGVGAETLKRLAGTRHKIRAIDRDFVDPDTLTRQTLYTKQDLGKLKTEAVKEKLGFAGQSEHLDSDNAENLLSEADVVLDCTDNWQTRCVINAWALQHETPWIFTSAIRQETMTTTLTPNTPCFVCWNPAPAIPRSCRIEGITRQTTAVAAETQVLELENLLNHKPELAGALQYTDVAGNVCLNKALRKNPACPACVKKTFRLPKTKAAVLCGDGEYLFDLKKPVSAKALASLKPKPFGHVWKVPWKAGEIVVFPGGRVLIRNRSQTQAESAFEALLQVAQS